MWTVLLFWLANSVASEKLSVYVCVCACINQLKINRIMPFCNLFIG